jgi:hypothetical protein
MQNAGKISRYTNFHNIYLYMTIYTFPTSKF